MMNTNPIQIIEKELQEAHQVLSNFMADPKLIETIAEMAHLMTQAVENGGKIITCGNGGSHCDAMHFAEELTGRYRNDRKSLPAIAIRMRHTSLVWVMIMGLTPSFQDLLRGWAIMEMCF